MYLDVRLASLRRWAGFPELNFLLAALIRRTTDRGVSELRAATISPGKTPAAPAVNVENSIFAARTGASLGYGFAMDAFLREGRLCG